MENSEPTKYIDAYAIPKGKRGHIDGFPENTYAIDLEGEDFNKVITALKPNFAEMRFVNQTNGQSIIPLSEVLDTLTWENYMDEHREEIIKALGHVEKIIKDIRDGKELPMHATYNMEHVGVTLKFRLITKQADFGEEMSQQIEQHNQWFGEGKEVDYSKEDH